MNILINSILIKNYSKVCKKLIRYRSVFMKYDLWLGFEPIIFDWFSIFEF